MITKEAVEAMRERLRALPISAQIKANKRLRDGMVDMPIGQTCHEAAALLKSLWERCEAAERELSSWDETHAKVLTENTRLRDELSGYYRMAGSGVWVETGKYAALVAARESAKEQTK